MGQLDVSVRDAFRFFAWYLTNGTLGINDILKECDYWEYLLEPPSIYENAWAVFVANLTVDDDGRLNQNPGNADYRAAQFLRAHMEPEYVVKPAFEPAELDPELPWLAVRSPGQQLHPTVRVATRDFAASLGRGQLDVLAGIDYQQVLVDGSSIMETVWSIFVNVLDISDTGTTIAPGRAMNRAAQFLSESCGGPQANPPWETWELELPFA